MSKYILIVFLLFSVCIAQEEPAETDSLTVETPPAVLDTLRRPQPPADVLHSFFQDTSAVDGDDYYSFGDILEKLNSVYYYHPGSMGQQNYASLFSGRAGQFYLDYDGLILNDAFTGLADLNVVPAENVGTLHILHHPQTARAGVWQMGNALQVNSLNIAALPIRTQVGYRNGSNNYNDVDVRVGIKPSVRTDLNFGATARSTNGSMTTADAFGVIEQNSSFNAYNADVTYDRQLSENWSGHYILHYYKGNTHFPIVQTDLYPTLESPMQKKERFDHGLVFRYKNSLDLIVQKSSQQNTWHGQDHKVVDEWYDADLWRVAALGTVNWKMLALQSGVQFRHSSFSRRHIGTFNEWQGEGVANILYDSKIISMQTGLTAAKIVDDGEFYLQPQFRLHMKPAQTWSLLAFAQRMVWQPSYHARFSTGPLSFGNTTLKPEITDRFAATLDYHNERVTAYLSVAQDFRENMVATVAYGDSAAFENTADHSVMSVGAGTSIEFFPEFFFTIRGNYFHQQDHVPANQPDYFTKFFFRYRRVFFQNDLDVTLRIGASVVGPRLYHDPWWADFSDSFETASTQLDPYVNATIVIKSMTWFVSLENYLGATYSRVYPYHMPSQTVRFGFMWNFVD